MVYMRDGVANLHLTGILDTRDNVTYIAHLKFLTGYHIHLQHTNLVGVILHAGIKELHHVTLANATVDNLKIGNDSTEGIEYGIKNQSL